MDYVALSRRADATLKKVGMPIKITRGTDAVGTGFGVFVASKAADDTSASSSLYAQTAITTKTIVLSGLTKEPLVGDTVLADKVTYLVHSVEKVRPTTVPLLYKIEVK